MKRLPPNRWVETEQECQQLEEEGIEKFNKPLNKLVAALGQKNVP